MVPVCSRKIERSKPYNHLIRASWEGRDAMPIRVITAAATSEDPPFSPSRHMPEVTRSGWTVGWPLLHFLFQSFAPFSFLGQSWCADSEYRIRFLNFSKNLTAQSVWNLTVLAIFPNYGSELEIVWGFCLFHYILTKYSYPTLQSAIIMKIAQIVFVWCPLQSRGFHAGHP